MCAATLAYAVTCQSQGKEEVEPLRGMKVPKVRFSPWLRWRELGVHKPPTGPGIYLLAHFKRVPRGPANHHHRRIVYVGETRGQSLRARLSQFDASATNRRSAHSGGNTYFSTYGKTRADDLCVAWFEVPRLGPAGSRYRSRFISFVEEQIIWDLTLRWGDKRLLNKAKASDDET